MSAESEQRTSGHGWTAPVLAIVLLAVEAVIVAESWRGLTGFAHLIGVTGRAAWGVPVTLDGVSLVAALTALRAELAGEGSGVYRATLFAFTAASSAANWWHGERQGGIEAALYLGGMSVAVTVVFALVLRQIRHEDRRRAGRVTAPLPKFSTAHWIRYPRLTWRAWSLAIRDGHTTPRAALDAALAPAGTRQAAAAVARHEASALPSGSASRSRSRRAAAKRQARVTDPDTEVLALAELARQPELSGAELGRLIGASPRTGQRLLSRLNGRAIAAELGARE